MSVETLTAVLGSLAALITAVTALITALRGQSSLKSHLAACAGSTTPAAQHTGGGVSGGGAPQA